MSISITDISSEYIGLMVGHKDDKPIQIRAYVLANLPGPKQELPFKPLDAARIALLGDGRKSVYFGGNHYRFGNDILVTGDFWYGFGKSTDTKTNDLVKKLDNQKFSEEDYEELLAGIRWNHELQEELDTGS